MIVPESMKITVEVRFKGNEAEADIMRKNAKYAAKTLVEAAKKIDPKAGAAVYGDHFYFGLQEITEKE